MSRPTLATLLLPAMLITLLAGCGNKTNSDDPGARSQRGNATSFESASEPPFNAETRFAAGQVAESLGNFDNAIAQYHEALKLQPNHREAIYRLANAYTQTRRYDEALPVWQRYLKVTRQAPEGFNNLALCYELAGRFEEAEQTFRGGIERDPRNETIRMNYGLMLARQGRAADAAAQLSAVLAPAAVQYNLGAVAEQRGKREEARAHYLKALELDPKMADARSRLAGLGGERQDANTPR